MDGKALIIDANPEQADWLEPGVIFQKTADWEEEVITNVCCLW